LATRFKLGKPVAEIAAEADGAVAEAVANGDELPGIPTASRDEVAPVIPDLTPAQIEQQQRQLDLDRLNTMPIATRRAIASMDMMGDYGSKVSRMDITLPVSALIMMQINFLVKHLLWYQTQDASTRHVVFSNWSDSLRSRWTPASRTFQARSLIMNSRHTGIDPE
jgi:hypothetical protein